MKVRTRSLMIIVAFGVSSSPAFSQSNVQSPLKNYPGFSSSPSEEAVFSAEEDIRQRAITACMKSKGFSYTPARSKTLSGPAQLNSILDRESQRLAAERENSETVKEYNIVLYGMEDPNSQSFEDHRAAAENGGGCRGEAFAKTPGIFKNKSRLAKELVELRSSIRGSSAALDLDADWSDCMQARGHSFSSPTDMNTELNEKELSAMRRTNAGPVIPVDLQQDNISIRNASSQCENEVRYDTRMSIITNNYEAEFVSENIRTLQNVK